MAIEILNGPIDGPYLADDGDIIIVSGDAIVRSDEYDSGAIDLRTYTETSISVIVDGRIRNTGDYGDGIRFFGQPSEDSGDHLIHVREGGVVTGYYGIQLGTEQNSSVVVSGRVKGDYSGIFARGTDLNFDITGTVVAGFAAALHLESVTNAVISNAGRLVSAGSGLFLNYSDNVVIQNTGVILGQGSGVLAAAGQNTTILNSGIIKTPNPSQMVGDQIHSTKGIEFFNVEGFHLDNSGRIEGGYAIQVASGFGSIVNSGKMIGDRAGLYLGPDNVGSGAAITIENTGLIKGEMSAYIYRGPVHITNSGTMDGDIFARNAQVTLINSGSIIGTVTLDGYDDIYQATGDGFVTRFVFGGDGQDRLTGGTRSDDLRGGSGDDVLSGRGGKDVLRGNTGNDRLTGGSGNDILIGGGGADVFVFAAGAGRDRVEDFRDGTDIFRIADHSGGFTSLKISDFGADLRVIHDGGAIILTGEAGTVLTSADFDFV